VRSFHFSFSILPENGPASKKVEEIVKPSPFAVKAEVKKKAPSNGGEKKREEFLSFPACFSPPSFSPARL